MYAGLAKHCCSHTQTYATAAAESWFLHCKCQTIINIIIKFLHDYERLSIRWLFKCIYGIPFCDKCFGIVCIMCFMMFIRFVFCFCFVSFRCIFYIPHWILVGAFVFLLLILYLANVRLRIAHTHTHTIGNKRKRKKNKTKSVALFDLAIIWKVLRFEK